MRTVESSAFFAAIARAGQALDVMPSIAHATWDDSKGYTSRWLTNRGVLVGTSDGRPATEYRVTDEFSRLWFSTTHEVAP